MTPEQLRRILVAMGSSPARAEMFAAPLAETMARYDITTPVRQKHFLGQVMHESGRLRYREEIASGAQYEGRRDLGNTVKGDGRRFKGRGLIQLTGRANYTTYDAAVRIRGEYLRLTEYPGLVATDTRLCCDVAGWFWDRHKLNVIADDPGMTEYETIKAITKRINGGYNGLQDRIELTRLAREAISKGM